MTSRLTSAANLLASDPAEAAVIAGRVLESAADSREQARALQLLGEAEYIGGRAKEALGPLRRSRDLFSKAQQPEFLIDTLLLLARVEREMALLDDAAVHSAEALELSQSLGDAGAECDALNIHAGVVSSQGKHVEAIDSLERALSIAQKLELHEQEANVLSNLGNLRRQVGDYPGALDSLKAAHELIRARAPGTRAEAVNLINLGHLYREMGDYPGAREFFSRAREVGSRARDHILVAASLNSLAIVLTRSEEWSAAGELYDEALEVSRRNGLRQYEIDNLDGLGQVYAALGDHAKAMRVHNQALDIARETGECEGEIDALLNLGRDNLALEQPHAALPPLLDAMNLAEAQGRKRSLFEAHQLLAEAYASQGEYREAFHHHQAFYRAEKVVFNEESEERVRRLTVQFDLERARHEAEAYRVRTEIAQQAREQAEAMVRERTRELEEAQQEIVARLAIAGEYRDDGTGEHTRRVGRNAAAIARVLGWPEEEAALLYSAARLHDVGKIGIRDSVLLKPGKLNDEEFELMRAHTTIGGRILSGGHSRLLRLAEEIAFAHHERWDGNGYPMGLSGDDIPMSARIVAVADVIDALTHERPYKDAWPVAQALAEIRRNDGSQFDPKVVAACFEVFGEEGGLCPTDDVPATALGGGERPKNSLPAKRQRLGMPLVERSRELELARREAEVAARRMQLVAFSDPLTGLGNRRAFEADLEVEVARALREGDSLAVLTIDLDALRVVNDREGHERGDMLLRVFAGAVHLSLQELGRVYRLAGDGFGAILTRTASYDANDIIGLVQEAVEAVSSSGFPTAFASAGVAMLPYDGSTVADLLRLSDQRMYRDKLDHRDTRLQDGYPSVSR